jgi:Predicted nucleic acid-binding protein, contains PIN domain
MIFVDTSAWLFLMDDRQELSNRRAAQGVVGTGIALVTSELIAAETFKWMLHHDRPFAKSLSVLEIILKQEVAMILQSTQDDRTFAMGLMRKFSDQDLTYEDAHSVALMNRFGIRKVLSFDKHFLLFPGIVRVP